MVGIHAFDGAVSSELFYAGASHEHRAEIAISAILPSLVELEGLSQADIDKLCVRPPARRCSCSQGRENRRRVGRRRGRDAPAATPSDR